MMNSRRPTRAERLVQAVDGCLVNPDARLLLMIKHQHAAALQVAVQRDAAIVRLVPALEELQRKEPPRFPRQRLELGEVKVRHLERERQDEGLHLCS